MSSTSMDTPRSLHLHAFASPHSPHSPHWPQPMSPSCLSVSRLHLCSPIPSPPSCYPAIPICSPRPFTSLLLSRLIHLPDFTSIQPWAPPIHRDAVTSSISPQFMRLDPLTSIPSPHFRYPARLTLLPLSQLIHLDVFTSTDAPHASPPTHSTHSPWPIHLIPLANLDYLTPTH